MVLLSDYLAAVPGTPIVERWLGEIKLMELKHRAHKLSGVSVEAAVRLIKQDMRGRRHAGECLNPTALLTKELPGTTSGGSHVVFPASSFALASQRCYREFYGQKALPGRDLNPLRPAEQSGQRHRTSKPCLGRLGVRSQTSVAARLRGHSAAVEAGAAALRAGVRDGPLGEVCAAEAAATLHVPQMVAAVREASALRLASPSEAPAPPGPSKRKAEEGKQLVPMAKQARILEMKRHAHVSAAPGRMPAYVGPRGEEWQAEKSKPRPQQGPLPKLGTNPKIFFGVGVPESRRAGILDDLGAVSCKKSYHADIVVVDSIYGQWESADALAVRLWGRCLADMEWARTRMKAGASQSFRPVFSERLKLYMSDAFSKEWPAQTKLLTRASTQAPSVHVVSRSKAGAASSATTTKNHKVSCFSVIQGKKPAEDKKGVSLLSPAELAALPSWCKTAWGLPDLIRRVTLAA